MMACERGEVADGVRPIIEATLKFYGKTEDELWDEVQKSNEAYEAYLAKEFALEEAKKAGDIERQHVDVEVVDGEFEEGSVGVWLQKNMKDPS